MAKQPQGDLKNSQKIFHRDGVFVLTADKETNTEKTKVKHDRRNHFHEAQRRAANYTITLAVKFRLPRLTAAGFLLVCLWVPSCITERHTRTRYRLLRKLCNLSFSLRCVAITAGSTSRYGATAVYQLYCMCPSKCLFLSWPCASILTDCIVVFALSI